MSLHRRLKRQQEREIKKLTAKIQRETLQNLRQLSDEDKFILAHQNKLDFDMTHLDIKTAEQ